MEKKYQDNALMCGIGAEQQESGNSLLQCVLNLGYNAYQENIKEFPYPQIKDFELPNDKFDDEGYNDAMKVYEDNHWGYSHMLNYVEEKYGKFARLIIQVGKCHQQIGNGGISQYWQNGYGDNRLHERMCELWDECIPRDKETSTASKFRTGINAYQKTIDHNEWKGHWGGADMDCENRIYDNCPYEFLTDRIRCLIYDVKHGSAIDEEVV